MIQEKSFNFSVQVIKLCKTLRDKEKDFIISKQLLRSGTSIGANVEEGIGCQSKKDFYFKFTIAYKEARESSYWLKVLKESGMIEYEILDKPISDCEEILKIIGSILKTLRNQQPPNQS